MAFISRLLNNRIAKLIHKFDASAEMFEQVEHDYPLEASSDHHRFLL